MNLKETLILIALFAGSVVLGNLATRGVMALIETDQQAFGSATSLCDVTEATVAIGSQAATTVLIAGSYQWAAFLQPVNATNTVSLSLGGTAVSGKGYLLTPATTSSPVPSAVFGFAPDMPYRGAVTARASAGSTTINVLSCR